MNILGISCYYHDAAAALLKDGILVAAAEEERFTRKKHDSSFPSNTISFCLKKGEVLAEDLDHVVFYEKPFLKFERILLSTLGSIPKSSKVFRESILAWFNQKFWIKNEIAEFLEIPLSKVLFVEHHLSHAASAFLASPYQDAAILTVDGVGEWSTTTLGIGHTRKDTGASEISLAKEIVFPHSLGLLYSAFTAFLGFRVNNGEYKVMGMAPYGEPRFIDQVKQLVDIAPDGSIQLDLDFFEFHYSIDKTYSQKFTDLFGPPRKHSDDFYTLKTKPEGDPEVAKINQKYADIAASIQVVTEDILLKMANYVHELTGQKNLCMAGGVALNSVANGRIIRETPFERVFIQPAAGDSGGALGAALYVQNVVLGQPRKFIQQHCYWGESYTNDEIERFCLDRNIDYTRVDDFEKLVERISTALVDGKVVAWFQDRFEWGPRALGNRSILADPRREGMKDIVNLKIKYREPFRPFAPVVIEEAASEYFDIIEPGNNYPAKFMLMVADVHAEKRKEIPAVTHVNGTGRLQIVNKDTNPKYHRLIEKFGEKCGVPVLLNTSFNRRGEPIANSPADALLTFQSSDIDILVMGSIVISKL